MEGVSQILARLCIPGKLHAGFVYAPCCLCKCQRIASYRHLSSNGMQGAPNVLSDLVWVASKIAFLAKWSAMSGDALCVTAGDCFKLPAHHLADAWNDIRGLQARRHPNRMIPLCPQA